MKMLSEFETPDPLKMINVLIICMIYQTYVNNSDIEESHGHYNI